MAANIPTRLVVCVDGTWFNPDGGAQKSGNLTNIYRLYASIQRGECIDSSGRRFLQEKHYVAGVGSEDNITQLSKGYKGAFGLDALQQIKSVYRECCRLTGPDDEVWLYGFSRGAYVVRAVAGLLHYMRALTSATPAAAGPNEGFDADYEEMLKMYLKMVKKNELPEEGRQINPKGNGQIHHFFQEKTRTPPKIQFLGVFDTIRRVKDKELYDIDWNDSIQNLRAALALNEDRELRKPKILVPALAKNFLHRDKKSFVQAWFIGTHLDMGGSAPEDGLALYPLQWMMLESETLYLVLGFDENNGGFYGRARLESPLVLTGIEGDGEKYTFLTQNGIPIEMRDIRHRHKEDGYGIQLGKVYNMRQNMWRRPFSQSQLQGYCDFAPQGTIVHPSVYLVMDHYSTAKKLPYDNQLRAWRAHMLGKAGEFENQGFWNNGALDMDDSGPIRILVCGNSGVGKSTLINKVFGVDATNISNDKAGKHDVNKEIMFPDRPDLIVHDSEGFESAGNRELVNVQEFLKRKSREKDINQRLHAVWFCIDASSCRMIQESAKKMFEAMSLYGSELAFIVVATKKDRLISGEASDYLNELESEGLPVDNDARKRAREKGEEELQKCCKRLEAGIKEVNGKCHAILTTSKFDKASIGSLNDETLKHIKDEAGRLRYVRAQTHSLLLKSNLAVARTMTLYRGIITSAALTAGIPGGPTTNRTIAVAKICETILSCFVLPIKDLGIETILEIARVNVPADIGNMLVTCITEGINTLGVLGSVATAMPVFLATAAINFPVVAVLNARIYLHLACDLILIFSRAFQDAIMNCYSQPQKEELVSAAKNYRQHCSAVHSELKKGIPPDIYHIFRVEKVAKKVEEVIDKWTPIVIEGAGRKQADSFGAEHRPSMSERSSGLSEGDETGSISTASESKEI